MPLTEYAFALKPQATLFTTWWYLWQSGTVPWTTVGAPSPAFLPPARILPLSAARYVSISGAVAHYYWAGGERSKMPPAPLLRSVRNTLTYHLGSIAFGSFVIALLQFVRMVFEWVAARFRKLQVGCNGWVHSWGQQGVVM